MSRLKWFVLGALVVLSTLGALWARHLINRPGEIARALSEALGDKLGLRPAVYVRDYVVVAEKRPIAELALVSRDTDVEHRIESVLLRSKAELALRAAFRVKAGFDLRAADFSLHLDPALKQARLDLPAPKVLSLEMIHYEVLADRSGWWNRISEDEKALAIRDLQARAKLEAIRAGILGDCRQRLDSLLGELSRGTGIKVLARYQLTGDTSRVEFPQVQAR